MMNTWISLQSINSANFGGPLKVSDTEWIIITHKRRNNQCMKYNSISNSWTELFQHHSFGSSHTLSFDVKSNKYYIFTRDDVIIIHGNNPHAFPPEKYEYKDTDVGITPVSVYINNNFHIIGGFFNTKHIVFDPTTEQYETVHTFNELETGNSGPGLVYVSSRNELILFGGFDDKSNNDGWLDSIWIYSFNNNIWKMSDVKLPLPKCDFPYLLTNNEKYIIIIDKFDIYYWRFGTTQFKQSNVKCPLDSYAKAAIMTGNAVLDEILVRGVIRNDCEKNNLLLPNDVVEIIINWYICEYIHILDPYTETDVIQHWKINIRHIIPDYR
eukprot:502354_1